MRLQYRCEFRFTGLKIALPPGTYGRIASRSGLAVKHNIEVGAGVIDQDYQGEIKVLLRNLSDTPYTISQGDKIAQLIVSPYVNKQVAECEKIQDIYGESGRGAGGFGSTGK